MKGQLWVVTLLAIVASVGVGAESPAATPAEQKIELARQAIAARPESSEPRNALALALARRARETSDPGYYEQASTVLQESLRLAPDNFEARKVEARVALGQREFDRALKLARTLNQRNPDDLLVYALLTDACIETGNYGEAEKATQWALDLRPGEIPGLTRAAHLRELFGDISGALEFVQLIYARTPPEETEDRAWILTQFAHLQLLRGKPDIAAPALADALQLFPNYHPALRNLVQVHLARGKTDEAVTVARELVRVAPQAENRYVLADVLVRAGRNDEAQTVFADFERQALAESTRADNANHELVFYYADHAAKPADALRIAELEMDRRQDVFTRHALAWALHVNGRNDDARAEMDKVLAVGIRDPAFLYHAGVIAARLGDDAAAAKYLRDSLEQSPNSEVADLTRNALAGLTPAGSAQAGSRQL